MCVFVRLCVNMHVNIYPYIVYVYTYIIHVLCMHRSPRVAVQTHFWAVRSELLASPS